MVLLLSPFPLISALRASSSKKDSRGQESSRFGFFWRGERAGEGAGSTRGAGGVSRRFSEIFAELDVESPPESGIDDFVVLVFLTRQRASRRGVVIGAVGGLLPSDIRVAVVRDASCPPPYRLVFRGWSSSCTLTEPLLVQLQSIVLEYKYEAIHSIRLVSRPQ